MNKALSQTFEYVGLYLPKPVYSHGQLYVGLSRAGSADRIKVYVPSNQGLYSKRAVQQICAVQNEKLCSPKIQS